MSQQVPKSEDFPALIPSHVAPPILLGPTYAKAIRPFPVPTPRHQGRPPIAVQIRPTIYMPQVMVSNLPTRTVRQQFPGPQVCAVHSV